MTDLPKPTDLLPETDPYQEHGRQKHLAGELRKEGFSTADPKKPKQQSFGEDYNVDQGLGLEGQGEYGRGQSGGFDSHPAFENTQQFDGDFDIESPLNSQNPEAEEKRYRELQKELQKRLDKALRHQHSSAPTPFGGKP